MSNLEHLIENGLSALKRGVGYEKWLKTMKDDVNWQGNENISIEQLWAICQYVIYTWIPSAQPEGKKGKWIKTPEFCGDDVSGFIDNHFSCSECKEEAEINPWGFYILSDFCPNCGADMRGRQNDTD